MSRTCKNTCLIYKKTPRVGLKIYPSVKRCRVCDLYVKWEGLRCPCCTTLLSIRSKDKKWRREKKRY